jgi:peroxiredoxin
MKICKPFLCFFLILAPLHLNANSVIVRGSGSGYNNVELRFFTQTDPVTKGLKPVMRIRCNENGSFSAEIPYDHPGVIYIKTGIFMFRVFLTGEPVYELQFPNYVPKAKAEEMNPFFHETELMPLVTNNKDDINNLIRDFDTDFDPIFIFVAERVMRNNRNEDILKEISKLDKYPVSQGNAMYNNYVSCRRYMLNLVYNSSVTEKQKALDFLNSYFDSVNPAFADLTEQVFSGYFNNFLSGTFKDSFARAIATASYSELKSVLLRDGQIRNKELADFVILLNLNKVYYDKTLPADNIRKILTLMRSQAETEYARNLAVIQLDKINSTLQGNYPPDFSLADNSGEIMSLKDFRGKYLLLSFARSDDPASMTELSVINMWQNKYAKDLQVVTILTDDSFTSGADRIKRNGFNWIFLNGSDRDNLEFKFGIKIYPAFILLDRDNKIIFDPCLYPSEDLELKINSIISGSSGQLIP